jgi:two-component sensor histidine kinase
MMSQFICLLLTCCLLFISCHQTTENLTEKEQQLQNSYNLIYNSNDGDSIKAVKFSRLILDSIQATTVKCITITDSIYEYLFNQWVANPESFSNIPTMFSKASINKKLTEHSRVAAALYLSLSYFTQYKIEQVDSLLLKIGKEENAMDDANKVLYLRNLGVQYNLKNKSQEATTVFQKAIDLVQKSKLNNPCELGNIYCNFAVVYLKMNDNNKALELLKKSFNLLSANNCNSNDLQTTILNIGVAYNNLHNTDSAIWYYKMQLPLITNNSIRNYTMSFIAYLNIGGAYIEEKKYDSARSYLAKASIISNKIKDNSLTILLNTFYAIANAPIKNVTKEVELIKGYLITFYKNNDLYDVQNAYESLNKIFAIKHEDKEALYYLEKLDSIKEIVTSSKNKKMVGELEAKYQTAQKDLEINKQQAALKQSYSLSIILFTCIIILVLVVVLRIKTIKIKKKREAEKMREHFTHQLLEGNEKERERIASDLHDDINQSLALLKKETIPTYPALTGKIDVIINDIRGIARNLYPVSLQLIGLKSSIEHLCEQMMNTHQLFISAEISYSKTFDKYTELQTFRIVQEALNNAIKHSNASAIKVTLEENSTKKNITLEIKDNGVGFDVTQMLKSKESFGLLSILQRSKATKGDCTITSNNNGTIIKVTIPYSIETIVRSI